MTPILGCVGGKGSISLLSISPTRDRKWTPVKSSTGTKNNLSITSRVLVDTYYGLRLCLTDIDCQINAHFFWALWMWRIDQNRFFFDHTAYSVISIGPCEVWLLNWSLQVACICEKNSIDVDIFNSRRKTFKWERGLITGQNGITYLLHRIRKDRIINLAHF